MTAARRLISSAAGHAALLLFFLAFLAPTAWAAWGKIVDVIDGDTVSVLLDSGETVTVRYLGIDTPEVHHPFRSGEELGSEASAANARMVLGRTAFLESDVQLFDRYGRMLAWVWIPEGEGMFLVNAELVRMGYADPFTLAPNVRHTDLVISAFREARTYERGFWSLAKDRVFTAAQAWAELPYWPEGSSPSNWKWMKYTSRTCAFPWFRKGAGQGSSYTGATGTVSPTSMLSGGCASGLRARSRRVSGGPR